MDAMSSEAFGLARELILMEKRWRVFWGTRGMVSGSRGGALFIIMGCAALAGGG